MEIKNKKISEEEFAELRQEVLLQWPTGKEVVLQEAVDYHKSLPREKIFADKLLGAKKSGRTLIQPRAGVPVREVAAPVSGVNVKAYRGDTGLLKPVLNKYPAERVVDIFKSMGLLCRETDGGRVYPYNMQASSVLNILLRRMESYGVEMVCGFDVDGVKKSGDGFTVSSQDGSAAAKKLIFAFGGMACPQSGSDGKCFSVLKPLGHKTTKLFPVRERL